METGTWSLLLNTLLLTGATCAISVPLGTVLGVVILREPPYVPKLVGVAIIFAGMVLVALG